MFAQIPTPPTGSIESWLIAAAGVGSLVLLGKQLFVRKPSIDAEFVTKSDSREFRDTVERDLHSLRDKIDARFLTLAEKIDSIKTEILDAGERRSTAIHRRMTELEASVARLDERTK